MVNCKNHLKRDNFQLWGGQNRINSIEYYFEISDYKDNNREFYFATYNNKTDKMTDTEFFNKMPPRMKEKTYNEFINYIKDRL